jgi:GAF domain-containing protein
VRSALYGETFVVNDPEHDLRLSGMPADRRTVSGKFISVPILTPKRPIGAINFGRAIEGRDLSESELRIGQSVASLAAIAIENQRLFDEMQRVLKEVDAINRHLTGEAWSTALRRARRSGVLRIGSGLTDDEPLPEMVEAFETRSVVLRERGAAEMTVAVPLMLRGIPIGVMHLRAPARSWDDDMAAMVTRIADHVAQSVENARLLEETEVRFARERALHESTDKVRRGTDVERIVQTAAEELARHLNASRVAVQVNLNPLESKGRHLNGETHSE